MLENREIKFLLAIKRVKPFYIKLKLVNSVLLALRKRQDYRISSDAKMWEYRIGYASRHYLPRDISRQNFVALLDKCVDHFLKTYANEREIRNGKNN